jgi:hypothetical protein
MIEHMDAAQRIATLYLGATPVAVAELLVPMAEIATRREARALPRGPWRVGRPRQPGPDDAVGKLLRIWHSHRDDVPTQSLKRGCFVAFAHDVLSGAVPLYSCHAARHAVAHALQRPTDGTAASNHPVAIAPMVHDGSATRGDVP